MATLTDALAELIPLVAHCHPTPGQARIVAHDINLPQERVHFEQAAERVWRQLFHLARLRRVLPALLDEVALGGYGSPHLVESVEAVRHALATDDGTDEVLSPGTERLPDDPAPSQLLDARHAVVPWHEGGRETVLEALEAWAAEPARLSVWLVHAEGGVGKTRLGIEWCRRLRTRQSTGGPAWCAGFLAKDAPLGWYDDLCAWGVSTMVVVDYAESRPELLGALRNLVRAHTAGGSPTLRVLLLARNDGDWWTQLTDDRELLPLLRARTPQRLAPVAESLVDREKVYHEAVTAFAERRRTTPTMTEDLSLEDSCFDRVLYLHMAALARVEGIDVHVGHLMDAILDHEERFWERRGREGDDGIEVSQHRAQARQIVVAATLRGGFATLEDARAVAKRMADRALDRDDDRLVLLLHRIYQRGTSVALAPLEPDLLGEAMAVRVGAPRRTEEAAPADWIDRVFPLEANDASVETAFTVLGRASVWTPQVPRAWMARMLRGPLAIRAPWALSAAKRVGQQTAYSQLGDLLAEALEAHGDAALGSTLERLGVPWETVSLRRVGTWVLRVQIGQLTSLHTSFQQSHYTGMSQEEKNALLDYTIKLSDYSARLVSLDLPDEAFSAIMHAIAIQEAFANDSTSGFTRRHANSLGILAGVLHNLGRRDEALDTITKSAKTHRKLSASNPELIGIYITSTINMAAILSSKDRHQEAISITEEAINALNRLDNILPDTFKPLKAKALLHYGAMLAIVGQHDDARLAAERSVGIYRALEASNSDAFLPDLAGSLSNFGGVLCSLKLYKDALSHITEAISIRQRLAVRVPDILPGLSQSYGMLGTAQYGLNETIAALTSFITGAEMIEPLRIKSPAMHGPLASELITQAREVLDTLGPDAPPDLVRRLNALSPRE